MAMCECRVQPELCGGEGPTTSRVATGIALLALSTFLVSSTTGCWRSVALTRVAVEREEWPGRRARVTGPKGTTEILVTRLNFPFLEGERNGDWIFLNLRDATRLEVLWFDDKYTKYSVFAVVVVGVGVAVYFIGRWLVEESLEDLFSD